MTNDSTTEEQKEKAREIIMDGISRSEEKEFSVERIHPEGYTVEIRVTAPNMAITPYSDAGFRIKSAHNGHNGMVVYLEVSDDDLCQELSREQEGI